MTTREMLNAIISGTINADVQAKAQEVLASLDKKNENRKSKPSKTAIANAPIKEAIVNHLNEVKHATASEVAEAMNITVQKASALLRQLAQDGVFTVSEVKVAKKGVVKNYSVTE